jgi:hypothetical protein
VLVRRGPMDGIVPVVRGRLFRVFRRHAVVRARRTCQPVPRRAQQEDYRPQQGGNSGGQAAGHGLAFGASRRGGHGIKMGIDGRLACRAAAVCDVGQFPTLNNMHQNPRLRTGHDTRITERAARRRCTVVPSPGVESTVTSPPHASTSHSAVATCRLLPGPAVRRVPRRFVASPPRPGVHALPGPTGFSHLLFQARGNSSPSASSRQVLTPRSRPAREGAQQVPASSLDRALASAIAGGR